MAALPSTGTGFSGITDNNFTDETPVLFLKDAAGAAFTIDADKRAFHTQRISSIDSNSVETTTGYRLYLTDNNSAATATEDINVYSISFDANGDLSEAIQNLDHEQLTEALIQDRFDLVGGANAPYPNLDPQQARIWVGETLSTTADNAATTTNRSLHGSNAGLLIASENLAPNAVLSGTTARYTSTDPGVVLLRDIDGDPITSSDGTAAGYQIDGQTILTAKAITEASGDLDVTTGFELLIKDTTGKVSSVQFSADGYRLAMDAASITETLNIQINPVNDAPEPTNNKPALPTGLENTDYTIKASDLVAYFTDVEGDTITLKEDSLEATNGQLVNNNDGTFTFTPDANFAGEVQLSYEVLDGTPGTFSTGSYSFNILPVNDPPARTDTSGFDFSVTFTIDEDANTTSLGLTGVTYGPGGGSDESGQTLTYTITSAPDAALGTLLLADGTTTVSDGQTITATQLQGLQFKPAADANGNTSFSFSVTDSGTVESDGSISQSAASQELPSIELIQREIALSTDLSGEGTIGVKVTSKLGTTAAGTANPSQPYAYDTSSGLLLSTNSAIPAIALEHSAAEATSCCLMPMAAQGSRYQQQKRLL